MIIEVNSSSTSTPSVSNHLKGLIDSSHSPSQLNPESRRGNSSNICGPTGDKIMGNKQVLK